MRDIPGMPPWASWSYGQEYLPPSFHTIEGFEKYIHGISKIPGPDNPLPVALVLAYGLAIRDVNRAHFAMPDPDEPAPANMPAHVVSSPLSLEHLPIIMEKLTAAV